MAIRIRESQIEDVFVTYLELLAQVLGCDHELRIVGRQLRLPSGRLDLLLTAANRLILVELKTVPFTDDALKQILTYTNELLGLQSEGFLLQAPIDPYLLVTDMSSEQQARCFADGVMAIQYSPEIVLNTFHSRLTSVTAFITLKPSDLGIWSIHLVNRVLYALPSSVRALSTSLSLATKTLGNLLRFSKELCLVDRERDRYFLTALGEAWVSGRELESPAEWVSDAQAALLRDFIVRDPFATSAIFGIYTIVEAIFVLAKNAYPVASSQLIPFFKEFAGKRYQWAAQKTALHGVKMYSNYAVELGLIAEVNDAFFLTPEGLRFVLLLQLHKGIKLVDAVRIHI